MQRWGESTSNAYIVVSSHHITDDIEFMTVENHVHRTEIEVFEHSRSTLKHMLLVHYCQ